MINVSSSPSSFQTVFTATFPGIYVKAASEAWGQCNMPQSLPPAIQG